MGFPKAYRDAHKNCTPVKIVVLFSHHKKIFDIEHVLPNAIYTQQKMSFMYLKVSILLNVKLESKRAIITRTGGKAAHGRGEADEARVCHHCVLPWVQGAPWPLTPRVVPFFFQQLFPLAYLPCRCRQKCTFNPETD